MGTRGQWPGDPQVVGAVVNACAKVKSSDFRRQSHPKGDPKDRVAELFVWSIFFHCTFLVFQYCPYEALRYLRSLSGL
jgi:hypothetical protein